LFVPLKTDFADQEELQCACLLSNEEEKNQCKKKLTSLLKKFRESVCSTASCCPYDTKSLIFKMRDLLVLEPNSHANREGGTDYGHG